MKKTVKKIWVSPITLILTAMQIVFAIATKEAPGWVFYMSMFINFTAIAVVNYNVQWLNKQNRIKEADKYRKEAGCNFSGIRFTMGLVLLTVIALISVFYPVNANDALNYMAKWYIAPFALVWFAKQIAKISDFGKDIWQRTIRRFA